jgi:tRNA(fMet)-specific endonuclease VapC
VTALLLDTTVLVDIERGSADLDQLIADDDDAAMAAVTVAELLLGVELAAGRRRERRQAVIDTLLGALPVVAYDVDVARSHAALLAATRRSGRPRGAHDLIIAATAKASSRTIVTADASGFLDLPGVALHRAD